MEALESSLSSDRLRGRNEREREGTLKQLEAAEARCARFQIQKNVVFDFFCKEKKNSNKLWDSMH